MVLAELNAYVSRPIAPTRRIALGSTNLPCTPAPGMGAVLLGAVVARFAPQIDGDSQVDLVELMGQIEHGQRIPQPRLRHRFQVDHIGLQPITYRMVSEDDAVEFRFETDKATPTQHALTAVYAAGTLGPGVIRGVIRIVRRAMVFPGGSDQDLVRFLTGHARGSAHALADPVMWAMEVLDLATLDGVLGIETDPRLSARAVKATEGGVVGWVDEGSLNGRATGTPNALPPGVMRLPNRSEIQRAFRKQLRHSHPDHGGERVGAAQRIADLAEARRILLDR